MPVIDVVALVLGLGIALVAATLACGVADSSDASMRWEAGVAVGFTALILVGPFWIAQAVLTVLATVDQRGIPAWWLWAWLFLAPVVGVTPPAVGLISLLKVLGRRRTRKPDASPSPDQATN